MARSQAALDRVRQLLSELGEDYSETADGKLKVEAGSTAVYITVDENDNHTAVCLLAPLLSDVAPATEQLAELLALNGQLTFGKFSWHPNARMLSLDYEMFAGSIDPAALSVALHTVAVNADKLDERLKGLLGGRLPHVES